MSPSVELLQGTLDLLILKTLALEPMHGWGIAQRIQQVSRDILQIQQGSLYPALYRLERKKWIRAEWAHPKIIAAPSSTPSPKLAASSSKRKWLTGSKCPQRLRWSCSASRRQER
jgi:hypothetical protein